MHALSVIKGLSELDVIGLRFKDKTAFLCEVTTHIRGTLYKDNSTTVKKITEKHQRQIKYANECLKNFKYQFWSPYVPEGYITENLEKLKKIELIINNKYTACIDKLKEKARERTNDEGNPFFRMLQILEHLKK